MNWISVKERYPDVIDADKKNEVIGWDRIQGMAHKCHYMDIKRMKIRFTHWMSIEPPKE